MIKVHRDDNAHTELNLHSQNGERHLKTLTTELSRACFTSTQQSKNRFCSGLAVATVLVKRRIHNCTTL